MLSENEIIIHKNQTEIIDFMEDINDTKIFKCKKCCWYGHNEICLNPVSEYSNKNVRYVKGCEDYHNYDEPKYHEDGGLI